VKLSFSEAAAKTVTVPDSLSDAEADAEEPDVADESESDDEQALRASRAAAPAPVTCNIRRVRRAERVITGELPLVLTDTSTVSRRIIVPQMQGRSLLALCMSGIMDLMAWHVPVADDVEGGVQSSATTPVTAVAASTTITRTLNITS
jgi:hypothetical protein